MAAGRRVRIYVDERVPLDAVARIARQVGAILVSDGRGNVVVMRREDWIDRVRGRMGSGPGDEPPPPPEAA